MKKYDVAVIGGGFAGVSAACALAYRGHRVTLIDPHGFLGGDAAAAQHTRIMMGGVNSDAPNGQTKMDLYARVKDAGVEVLMMARCAGILTDGNKACGVLIATKYGVQAVQADAVIDATENGIGTFHLTGRKAKAYEAEYGFDVEKAPTAMARFLEMPEELGLVGNQVILTRTIKAEAVNVSFRFPVDPEDGAAGRSKVERRAHDLMISAALELRKFRYFSEAKIYLVRIRVCFTGRLIRMQGFVRLRRICLPNSARLRKRRVSGRLPRRRLNMWRKVRRRVRRSGCSLPDARLPAGE